MDKVKIAVSALMRGVFVEFVGRGGMITNAGREIDPGMASAPDGLLPAFVWVAGIFYRDHDIPFPNVAYTPQKGSHLGYVVDRVETPGSASPFLLMLSDFLNNEAFPEHVVEFDVSPLVTNFQEWCRENAMNGPSFTLPNARPPEENP